jgi:MFS family permease
MKPSGFTADYWRFMTGQVISSFGSSFTVFALPLLVYRLTGSALNLGVSTAINLAPYLLFGLAIGAWVDRVDRKRMMIVMDTGRAVLVASIPVMALTGHLTVEWIYAVGFLTSTLGIAFESGQFAAVPSLVGKADLVRANGQMQASFSVATIAGPLLAGAMLAFTPVSDILYVDAASFVVSAVSLAIVRTSFNTGPRRAGTSIREDVREGLQFIWNNRVLRLIAVMMMQVNFVVSSVDALIVLFATLKLHATNAQIGWLYSAGAVGVVALAMSAGPLRTRLAFGQVALGALAANGIVLVLLAVTRVLWVALPEWALVNGLGVLFNIYTGSLRQSIVPNQMLGRVAATSKVLAWGVMPLGALLGGALANATGDVVVIYICAGALTTLIALCFGFTVLGHVERYLETVRPPAVPDPVAGPVAGPQA